MDQRGEGIGRVLISRKVENTTPFSDQINLPVKVFNLPSVRFNLSPTRFNLSSARFNLSLTRFNLSSNRFNISSARFNLWSVQIKLLIKFKLIYCKFILIVGHLQLILYTWNLKYNKFILFLTTLHFNPSVISYWKTCEIHEFHYQSMGKSIYSPKSATRAGHDALWRLISQNGKQVRCSNFQGLCEYLIKK